MALEQRHFSLRGTFPKNTLLVTQVTLMSRPDHGTTDREIAPAAPVPVAAVATEPSLPGSLASKLKTCRSGLPPTQVTSRYFPVESSDMALGPVPVWNGELESAVKAPVLASVYPVMTLSVRLATYTWLFVGSTTIDAGPSCD
jgi:hypothetical protein